jgi:hypothetical protein
MRVTTIENVRSGDVVKLECNGRLTYHLVVFEFTGYSMEQISREQYVALYEGLGLRHTELQAEDSHADEIRDAEAGHP